jgi:hypothetical protein
MMMTYLTDCHGDPNSPANGRLSGLFFSVNMDKRTRLPPATSIYGDQRLQIGPDRIIQMFPNLYFTDFHCIKEAHYVTLVMTRSGTASNLLYQTPLVPMSLNMDHDICRIRVASGKMTFLVTTVLWMEIMVTEVIDTVCTLRCTTAPSLIV